LKQIAKEMLLMMYAADGVGLAAPQVRREGEREREREREKEREERREREREREKEREERRERERERAFISFYPSVQHCHHQYCWI
jgi:hypothetical protein